MNNPTPEQIKNRLQDPAPAIVTFTKVDGSKRVMRCTTNPNNIPKELQPTGTERYLNPDVARVFDLDLNEWRSFRINSVISIT